MKTTIQLITSIACFALGAASANAALKYWDANGTSPGGGDAFGTADGWWGLDAFWNANADGTGTPGAWTDNDTAVFSAGTDVIFDSEITLFSDQSVAGFRFEEGQVQVGTTDGAGTITLTGAGGPIYVGPDTSQPTIAKMVSFLSGNVGLTKTGSGTLFLVSTGEPTYTGNATNIDGINFTIGTLIDEGALSVGDGGAEVRSIDSTTNHSITLGTNATLIFNGSSVISSFSGLISGHGSVVKNGAGSLKFGSGKLFEPAIFPDDSYTGDTIVNEGRLICAGLSGHAIPTGPGKGNVFLNTNGVLDPGTITINGLFGYGVVTNRSGDKTNVLTVGNADVSSTFDGVITKAGGTKNNHVILTKIGTGTLTLTGRNSYYAGPTTVMGGTLMADCPTHSGESSSTGNSPVIVNSGATLGGNGMINGPVTIEAGGVLSPGGSVGKLTLYGDLNLAGNLYIEVNKPANDVVSVVGTLSNTGTGNTLTVVNVGGALSVGDKFQIFDDGVVTPKAMSNGGALTVVSSGVTWINNLGVDGSITVASVPGGLTKPKITSITGVGTTSVTVNYNNAIVNTNYTLQYNTNLGTMNWYDAASKVATGTSDSQTDTTAVIGQKQRNYRLKFLSP